MSIKTEIDLYNYQKGAIDKIFERFEDCPSDYHLLYQLPTGGGKTIIFSEIVRQYLKLKKKKVVVLTHRIELCNQTSKVLSDFGVLNKVVNSKASLANIEYNPSNPLYNSNPSKILSSTVSFIDLSLRLSVYRICFEAGPVLFGPKDLTT